MRLAYNLRLLSALALTVAAAGCVAGGGSAQRLGPVGTNMASVEGSWVDENGVGVSTFSNGVFTTTAVENGNRLSEGSYSFNGGRTVAINGTSLIRQQPIAFNCNMASQNQLNCTSAEGNRFVLTRRA